MLYMDNDIIELTILNEINKLKQENDLLKQWIKKDTGHNTCAVCGELIDNVSIQRATRAILWHDRNCYKTKPGKIIKLERDFKCDIVTVLKETTKKCGNIKTQCHLLGLSIPYLYATIRKYCGENYLLFMAHNSVGKRKELYARKVKNTKIKPHDSNKSNIPIPSTILKQVKV